MDISKYKGIFLQETNEHLLGIEKQLLELEKGASDQIIDSLFRHYHSIKGMSASMGYEPLKRIAHAQEDVLDKIRSKKTAMQAGVPDALLSCLDAMKELARRVEKDEPLEISLEPVIEKLLNASAGKAVSIDTGGQAGLRLANVMKVDGRVFDDLLTIVGDLFISLSTFKGIAHASRSIELRDAVHLFGKSVNALHANIISVRMLPIEALTDGLGRVVRDISKACNKEIELKIEGADISLDRSILEGLGSPLVHIIRNAVDHGIEPVEERVAAGKPATGKILVEAAGDKESVTIRITDDGRGIDVQKVKKKALEKGLPLERVQKMSGKEAMMLVCMPGLSSADTVTETSGRGVGMDVVKSSIEALGGKLAIDSAPGKGTAIALELPKTTSIIKAFMVTLGKEIFLIPISKVSKVIEIERENISSGFIDFEGRQVPVVHLDRAIGLQGNGGKDTCTVIITELAFDKDSAGNDAGLAGVVVDDFGDEMNALIRPLAPPIQKLWGASGITVAGDGRPLFLLDLQQILFKELAKAQN